MGQPTYVRMSGHHVAERIRPVPGSEDAQRFAALADDPSSGWRVEDVPEPATVPAGRPAQSAPKDAWVQWAVACGATAEVEAMTKADLITQYGGA